ncbi:hypothetical protein KGP84_22625 [Burkholderia multivorans]|uniref:hypothetical protein n=1 Tax=Burkholderia multivorans TaxID=87883 RepID=UPI00209EB837|nr:hypothetical protein [Burkholderia multivorans]MCO8552944.1 hypothetical protein [Burkholderia multivorans]
MSLLVRAEIIKVIIQYLPVVPKTNYYKDKSYTQELYVETACDRLGVDYFTMPNYVKHELCDFAHEAIVREYKNIAKSQKQAVSA